MNKKVKHKQSRELAIETTVTVVDAIFGFLTNVSPIKSSIDTYSKIKANLFEEKLRVFFDACGSVSEKEKNDLIKRLDNESDSFFKHLWIILDRYEQKEKAIVLGKLFRALIDGNLSSSIFKRLADIIDRTLLPHLEEFLSTYSHFAKISLDFVKTGRHASTLQCNKFFATIGIMDEYSIPTDENMQKKSHTGYTLTSLGELFATYGH